MGDIFLKKISLSANTAKKASLIFFLMSLAFCIGIVFFGGSISSIVASAVTVFFLGTFIFVRPLDGKPMAKGRVYAIIPAYNEDPRLLYEVIEGILNQTRVPEAIYVMDDGSAIPIPPYEHPLVHWYRQENAGKRHAQAALLKIIGKENVDFLLTVDSDSVLDPRALENLLKAMFDTQVYAVTGTVVTRNYNQNLLTYIQDLNIGRSCIQSRSSHTLVGAMETTSGALALYRKEVFYDNIEDYLSSGTYGDDRRLCTYANLRGRTAGVDEAFVFSEMPVTLRQLWWQRVRWSKSGWAAIGFMAVNYNLHQILFPLMGLIQKYVLVIIMLFTIHISLRVSSFYFWLFIVMLILVRIPSTAAYLLLRPQTSILERIGMLVFIAPLEALFCIFFFMPASYYALFRIKDKGWSTR